MMRLRVRAHVTTTRRLTTGTCIDTRIEKLHILLFLTRNIHVVCMYVCMYVCMWYVHTYYVQYHTIIRVTCTMGMTVQSTCAHVYGCTDLILLVQFTEHRIWVTSFF